MRIGICPGSFDPVTLGHVDIMTRAAGLFDVLYVAVLDNPSKRPLFSAEERVDMLKHVTAGLPSVRCETFSGLVVDYAVRRNAQAIVRGVRSQSDYEYELRMASMNKQLAPEVETLFLPTAPEYAQVSSSLVKEVAAFGGRVDQWLPEYVSKRLYAKLNEKEGGDR